MLRIRADRLGENEGDKPSLIVTCGKQQQQGGVSLKPHNRKYNKQYINISQGSTVTVIITHSHFIRQPSTFMLLWKWMQCNAVMHVVPSCPHGIVINNKVSPHDSGPHGLIITK